MNKIAVYQSNEGGKLVLGIKVLDRTANLQDLLDIWQPLCDDTGIHKTYAADFHDVCKGCQVNCCNTAYVIPDLVAFKKMAGHLQLEPEAFMHKYFQSEKLNAGLMRLAPNPCIFLNQQVCTIYAVRSLICRFYICTPLAGETEELIYKLSWAGAAATQIFAENQGLLSKDPSAALSSFDLLFYKLLEDYRGTKMVEVFLKANEYRDIPLEPFLPEE